MNLDHFTIRTRNLPLTRDFFLKVFEMEERERPAPIQKMIKGHWLFYKDHPYVHLIESRYSSTDQQAEAIDHVGIAMEGYRDFKRKIQDLGIHYSLMDLPELEERRIFFRVPAGPLLETVFHEKII